VTTKTIRLTRLSLGQWETEVAHPYTGEIQKIEVELGDECGNPSDDFGKDRIDKLVLICEDAFALKSMYLERIIEWRKGHFHESPDTLCEFDEDEINEWRRIGIDVTRLSNREEVEVHKWAAAFRLETMSVSFGFFYRDYYRSKSREPMTLMSASVIDPGGRRWACSLGDYQHNDGEGWIEFG
jgi:hypothetical protein